MAVDALSREVANDYKVVITGDGGDEVFGGYLTYKATELYRRVSRFLPAAAAQLLAQKLAQMATGGAKASAMYKAHRFLRAFGLAPAVAHFTWNGTWLPTNSAELLAEELRPLHPVEQAIEGLISRTRLLPSPELRSLQMADMLEYLPNDILTKMDRLTMAHGLESRAPFLNPGMAEFGMALQAREKVRLCGQSKRLLRALAERTFPNQISAAKKQGFSIPVHHWLRHEMRDSLELFLSRDRLACMPFLDSAAVIAQKERHLAKTADLGFELWGLMALSAWWHQHNRRTARRGVDLLEPKRVSFPPFHSQKSANLISADPGKAWVAHLSDATCPGSHLQ